MENMVVVLIMIVVQNNNKKTICLTDKHNDIRLQGIDMSKCISCGAEIIWATTKRGKKMPLNKKTEKRIILNNNLIEIVDTYVSHFTTCPMANKHRSKKGDKK